MVWYMNHMQEAPCFSDRGTGVMRNEKEGGWGGGIKGDGVTRMPMLLHSLKSVVY